MNEFVQQVDVATTIALMHGLSVPRDSLGVPLVRVLAQLGHNHVQVSAHAHIASLCTDT